MTRATPQHTTPGRARPVLSGPGARPLGWLHRMAPVGILLLAFALRTFGLGRSDLVIDEGVSFFIAGKSIPGIIAYCLSALWEHPPGYYILLHGWMRALGTSEFALRFLSVLGGMAGVALALILARRWFGHNISLLMGLLLAVSPMAVDYARNARMYSLLMALSLLAAYLFDRALVTGRRRDWLPFAGVLLIALTMHYLIAFVLLAYGLFLLIRWRHLGRGKLWFTLMLGGLALAGAGVLLAFPGPRTSLMDLVRLRLGGMNAVAALEPVFTHWPLGLTGETLPRAASFPLAACIWLLAVLGIAWLPRPVRWPRRDLQWLLALLISAPPLAQWFIFPGKVLFPGLSARHTSATFGMFMLAVALGMVGLWRKRQALGRLVPVAVITLALALSTTISVRQMLNHDRFFSPPWRYANERAADGELFIYTYFFDWPQNSYYNRRQLPTRAIPPGPEPFSDADAVQFASDVVRGHPSWWLSLYVGRVETERVEQAFNRQAFPAGREWLPGERGIVHYFAPAELTERPAGFTWEAGFALPRYSASSPALVAGDALRLMFEWTPTQKTATRGLISLKLVGPDGRTWAQRLGGPCNDRCPTDEWDAASVLDRQAFEIPADTPPGEYELRLGWLGVDGAAWPGRSADAAVAQVELPLLSVTVLPGMPARPAAPLPVIVNAAMGEGLLLRSAGPIERQGQVGGELALPLQWRVTAPPGGRDVALLLRRDGVERHRITQPLGPAWRPSAAWDAPRVIRTQAAFTLPATAAPGVYDLAIGVSAAGDAALLGAARIGQLTVTDRPRSFETPALGEPVAASWAEGIQLVRVDAPARVAPGASFKATLVWQAAGPASRNWKVFFHLVDEGGEVRAQGDAFPQDGGAPASGWRTGEVIVDTHTFTLAPDAAPGIYRLQVGFYDAESFERLALREGGDTFVLPAPVQVAP